MSASDSLGPALRDARDALGLSASEVATHLKVPRTVVEDIEAERLEALPARVFARAYIRSYADLVELDPDEMVSAYDRQMEPDESAEIESRPLITLPRTLVALCKSLQLPQMQSWVFGGTVILFTALAGIFLWFAWPSWAPTESAPVAQSSQASTDDDAKPVSSADEESYESAAPAAAPAPSNGLFPPDGPIAQNEAPVPDAISVPDGLPDGPPNGLFPPDGPIAQNEAPVPHAISVPDGLPDGSPNGPPEGSPNGFSEIQEALASLSNPLTYTPGDDHVLVFRFTHDCWVEVFDAAGDLLHQDLEHAEDELKVRGDAPFSITLGYAPGVQLEYNGERVMLAQHTHNDIAKLVLGL